MSDAHEQILRRLLHKIADEQEYKDHDLKVTPMTSDGANYTTILFRATISAPNKPDLKLFAKVAAIGEKFRSQMPTQIFDVEHYSYTTLANMFNKIQDKYDVPDEHRLMMPKFYGYDGTYLEETLVMQDLTEEGFVMHDRMASMGWEYAARSLEELAKMHALSIVFQEEYPEEFEDAAKVFKTQDGPEQLKSDYWMDLMKQMTTRILAVTDEEYRERLEKFFEKVDEEDFWKRFYGPQKRPVLEHGDFKMSNLMQRHREDKLEVVPVDYQCVHVGVGIRDVLFFLLSGTDEDFRGKHFHQLLDHYYEQLCLMLLRLGQEPEALFPREDYDWEVETNLPCGVMVAMFVLPVVTVAAEDAPKVDGDLALESITDAKTSELSESRIKGLVRDCVRWGIM